jgi:3-oxoacyl-[acyl-carrier-protein] synthase II
MRERVLVTGIGSISSFGVGHRAYADAVLAGTSGIGSVTAFDTSSCRSHRAAMVRGFDPAAFVAPLKLRRVDEVGRLALACARLVLDDAGVVTTSAGHDDVGIALGTFTAGLDSTVAYLNALTDGGPANAPALLFSNTVSNAPASLCAIEFGLRGPNVTFNQREASSLAALAFGIGAVRDRRVTAMIAGGADRIEETFYKVHDRFHALSPMRAGGDEAARPFDRRRNGFVLGEGGFFVLLEGASAAQARGARVYGEILGFGSTASRAPVNGWPAEAHGLARAMRLAMCDASLAADRVEAVFGTANGSPGLDALEAAAIGEVFGERRVLVSSVKGATGESGASGASALVAGLLSFEAHRLPPTAGWSEPDPACALDLCARAREVEGRVFLVNSVASGGTNYAALVRAGDHG